MPTPELGPTEVRIRVHTSGVNRGDVYAAHVIVTGHGSAGAAAERILAYASDGVDHVAEADLHNKIAATG